MDRKEQSGVSAGAKEWAWRALSIVVPFVRAYPRYAPVVTGKSTLWRPFKTTYAQSCTKCQGG